MKKNQLKKLLLTVLCLSISIVLWAQSTVRGRVLSEDDQKPLSGVSVVVKGGSQGTQSNDLGEFSIDTKQGSILVFTYSGFTPKEVKVVGTTMEIILKVQTAKLDEVVVVGYGTQNRRKVTTSISSVDKKVLESVPRTNAATALQGTVAGVMVQQSTGQPGSTPNIVIRGGTNFNGSGTPLYIVDGVQLTSLFGLNADDIETIDILKDAASLAIYGARAGNGVVVVTTKKGKKGKTQINYTYRNATNYVRRNELEYLSPEDYIKWNRIGLGNRYALAKADNNNGEMTNTANQLSGAWGFATNSAFRQPNGLYSTQLVSDANRSLIGNPMWHLLVDKNPIDPTKTDSILYRATNQRELEDLILQKSHLNEHYLNFSGANEQGAFALGIGTIKDIGILRGSDMKRMNMNFNGALNINKDLKVTTTIGAYSYKGNPTYLAGDVGIIQRFAGIAPTVRLTNDTSGAILPGVDGGSLGNPDYLADKFIRTTQEQRFSGGLNFEYNILKNLKLLASGSGFMRYFKADNFNKLYQNGTFGQVISARASSLDMAQTTQYTLNAFLQYAKNFNKHSIDVLAGPEYTDFKIYNQSASGVGSAADNLPFLSNSIYTETRASSGVGGWRRSASVVNVNNYSYDNRYLARVTLRYDGTSEITSKDNRYNLFPGISFGWNAHNENFFRNSKISNYISSLKPRLSWGQNGVINSGDFGTVQTYSYLGLYNGVGGYAQTNFVNPNLAWEKTTTYNAGVDIGFLKDRFVLIFDYFVKDVYDKLQSPAIPIWTGFGSYTTNLATLRNKGVEAELKANILRPANKDGVALTLGANVYHVKSFVKKLLPNGLERNRQGAIRVWNPKTSSYEWVGGLQEGMRVGNDEIWAPIFDGVYKTQEELTAKANLYNVNLPTNNKRIKQLGDAKWRDIDANDTIDSKDFVFVGRATPQVMGGFSLNTSWKGFTLFGQFDYALGFYILNQIRMRGLSQVQGSQNSPNEVTKTWTPENPNADLPRYMWANYGRNYETGAGSGTSPANFWEKGNYVSMREITLSYTVPTNILNTYTKSRIKGFKVYVAGSNLIYFSKYTGTFPEVGGFDNGKYPLPRVVTFGLNATL